MKFPDLSAAEKVGFGLAGAAAAITFSLGIYAVEEAGSRQHAVDTAQSDCRQDLDACAYADQATTSLTPRIRHYELMGLSAFVPCLVVSVGAGVLYTRRENFEDGLEQLLNSEPKQG